MELDYAVFNAWSGCLSFLYEQDKLVKVSGMNRGHTKGKSNCVRGEMSIEEG